MYEYIVRGVKSLQKTSLSFQVLKININTITDIGQLFLIRLFSSELFNIFLINASTVKTICNIQNYPNLYITVDLSISLKMLLDMLKEFSRTKEPVRVHLKATSATFEIYTTGQFYYRMQYFCGIQFESITPILLPINHLM